MADETPESPEQEAERRELRPYRRLVGGIFTVALAAMCAFILRGIIRTLDRMPSVENLVQPGAVDTRALRACAEDLDKLEARTRKEAGKAFASDGDEADAWEPIARALELERLQILARCHLHQASDDPVVHDLATAASGIEGQLRSYSLLYARHRGDGAPLSRETRSALERASAALRSR